MATSIDDCDCDKLLSNLSNYCKSYYKCWRDLKRNQVNKSLALKIKECLKHLETRTERLKNIYGSFVEQIEVYCENYVNEVNVIENEEKSEAEELKDYVKKIKDEMEKRNEKLNQISFKPETKEPSFLFRNSYVSKIDVRLVKKYPNSYLYKEYMSDHRTEDGNIYIDIDSKNADLIAKYMKDDYSLNEDLKKLDNEEKSQFLYSLGFLKLPIISSFLKQIRLNNENEIIEAWRNKHIMINNDYSDEFNELLKKCNCFDLHFNNERLKNIHYDGQENRYYIQMKMKYANIIKNYLENGFIDVNLIERCCKKGCAYELINEMKRVGIELNEEEKEIISGCLYQPLFEKISAIIKNSDYDRYLQRWAGDYKWRLIYSASKHEYTASSFHQYCDNKGPTLVVIKSSKGSIFGGFTTQQWSEWCIYFYDVLIKNRCE